jgi:hypothetical protein
MTIMMAPRESAPGGQACRAISQPAKPRDAGGANCLVLGWGEFCLAGTKCSRENIKEY